MVISFPLNVHGLVIAPSTNLSKNVHGLFIARLMNDCFYLEKYSWFIH
jgi:hypothetical protein